MANPLPATEAPQEPNPDPALPATDLDDSLLPDVPSVWSRTLNVRTAVGYNDNLSQDAARSEESLAVIGGLEATLFRLPLDGRQVMLFLSGDYIHYPNGDEVEREASILALGQAKLDVSPRWQTGLDLKYQFIDQVIDTTITENTVSSELVRGHGLSARPSVTTDLKENLRARLDAGVTRQFLDGTFDDYWETGPRVGLERDYGNRSSVALSYEWKWRDYDNTRENVDSNGDPITDTTLDFQIHEAELAWRHHWDAARRWRTTTRLGFFANRDNGSGYYNYDRYQVSVQGRYGVPEWEVKAQVRLAYYDFAKQSADSASESRSRIGMNLVLRGERQLMKHLRLFAEYAFEETFSNRATDEYRVNKVAGGIDCGF